MHVWVDETRPRNQGAALTAWELGKHGVPHTVIADNAGGHLMQHGQVDLAIVGTDRVTRTGDVANKIGTYLKALAARDNNLPFWVALPSTTIDWTVADGVREIPIEERSAAEVTDTPPEAVFTVVSVMVSASVTVIPVEALASSVAAAVFIEIEPAGALAVRRPVDVTKPEPEMPPLVALIVTSPPEVVLVSTTLPAL